MTGLGEHLSILNALAKDYMSLCVVNTKTATARILKASGGDINEEAIEKYPEIPYEEMCRNSAVRFAPKERQKEAEHAVSLPVLMEHLAEKREYSFVFEVELKGERHDCLMKYIRLDEPGYILAGFQFVDAILAQEKEQRKRLTEAMAKAKREKQQDEAVIRKSRRELEEALEKERATNEVLMAVSKIYYAIFSIDLENDLYEEIFNESRIHHLTGITGCASEEMEKMCRAFVVPEYQERILRFLDIHTMADRLQDEETIAAEYLAKDGNWHTARFIVKRRNEEGRVTQVLYVTRLISDAKRREQNWIAIAEAANQANEAKTNFLRHMSHDIRTPINGILGMIEMADRHRDDVEKLQECRQKTLGATEYLLSLVNNVLDIGKLEANEIVMEHKPFDLIPLLMKMLPVIEIQASEHGIRYEGGKEMSRIRHRYLIGSPVHLNRVLMNLAGNAIKYNRKGGSVTVYCTELSSDEKTAVYQFICADTGIGMSEEFQKRAFEPFTQEGKESVSTYSGSGLGLSIVKKFVEKMDGTIELESKEGVGTTFRVTIPFEIDTAGQESVQNPKKREKVDLTGKRALLVEDNELNQEIAKMLLEDEGLVLTTADNGKEAVERFAESPEFTYDFIFMDIMMPVMDGLEATRQIRALPRRDAGDVPILAMTANAFQDDIQQSMEAGMNDHLMKPLDMKKIRQAMQEHVRK